MQGHEKFIKRNCRLYAMNESLFGQSRAQLQNMMEEMQIGLDIRFERCYLIVTGLSRERYMQRLGMRRADLLVQMDVLEEELAGMAREMGFAYEIGVLNYDYSKRFVLAISPHEQADIEAIARHVNGVLEKRYAQIAPGGNARNITVYGERIDGYEAYQHSFAQLRETYARSFFLRECDLLTAQRAQESLTTYSMLEAERKLSEFSDLLYLRDLEGACALLGELLLHHLKRAQDERLLREVLVFLKKRMQDICLVLGVQWTGEMARRMDMEQYLFIEELYDALCAQLGEMLGDSAIPPIKPDGLAIRAARYISKHYYEPLDLTGIAKQLYVTPAYLSHTFKSEMREGITQYITRVRIEQAQRLLRESDLRIAQIAQNVGLADPKYFNTVFKRRTGCTPSEYREKHLQAKPV